MKQPPQQCRQGNWHGEDAKLVHLRPEQYPHVGDSSQKPVIVLGVQTVDVSLVDASRFGHSYFYESREIMADLYTSSSLAKAQADGRFGPQAMAVDQVIEQLPNLPMTSCKAG